MVLIGALYYGFPSRNITVIGVTGTKGKTTTAEVLASILETAGNKVALSGTVHFKIGDKKVRNLHKMSMPGRMFMQNFLRDAVDAGCDYAVLELTSEGVKQFRHKFISLDGLIFTGIHPEHIESHGSFRKYLEAKLELAKSLERSDKSRRVVVANADDDHGHMFLEIDVQERLGVHMETMRPYISESDRSSFSFDGRLIQSTLPGEFNIMNLGLAAHMAQSFGIETKDIERGIEAVNVVPGRMDFVTEAREGHGFDVIVDYAHTPESLEAVYRTCAGKRIIAVHGSTGGGRDTWKRPLMGRISGEYAYKLFLTNEDPYDENPQAIIDAVAAGVEDKSRLEIVLDRRVAIARALKEAATLRQAQGAQDQSVIVLILGKGTDPFIMGPNGSKQEWSDKQVAIEELAKL